MTMAVWLDERGLRGTVVESRQDNSNGLKEDSLDTNGTNSSLK